MSGSSTKIPNTSVPIQLDSGFVNHAWYLYLAQLAKLTAPGGTGVAEITVGEGLAASAGGTNTTLLSTSGTLRLNLDTYGATEGNLLTRGPSDWEGLAPGSIASVLTSAGPGQVPYWNESSNMVLPQVPPIGLLGNADPINSAPANGVLLTLLLDSLFGNSWGTVAFRGQNGWEGLAPGASPGLRLTSGGPSANVYWARPGLNIPSALADETTLLESPLGFVSVSGNNITLSDGLGS